MYERLVSKNESICVGRHSDSRESVKLTPFENPAVCFGFFGIHRTAQTVNT